jgi:methylmalonyl-CoA/ethylmalonyl-CoA epimerase
VDHIAIAVEDLTESARMFGLLLGAEPLWEREVADQQVRVVMFRIGEVKVELMAGTAPESTVSRFVAERGPGLHHVCYAVDDLPATIERLRDEGLDILGTGEDVGVEGRPVVFVHPRSTGGVLTEFIEGSDAPGEG